MEVEKCKRSYDLPKRLIDYFKYWCRPGQDYNPKVAGAILLYMCLPADFREHCSKMAYLKDPDRAISELKHCISVKPKNEEEDSILGGFVGGQWEFYKDTLLNIECLFTDSGYGLAGGVIWKF